MNGFVSFARAEKKIDVRVRSVAAALGLAISLSACGVEAPSPSVRTAARALSFSQGPALPSVKLPAGVDIVSNADIFGFVACNALQIEVARQPLWEPALRELGATRVELRLYRRQLEQLRDEICALRLTGDGANAAFDGVMSVLDAVDARLAADRGISFDQARAQRLALVAWRLRDALDGCFPTEGAEDALIFARLPLTPSIPGLSAGRPVTPISETWGSCITVPTAGPSAGLGAQSRSLSACMAEVAEAHEACDHPAGGDSDDTTPEEVAEQAEEALEENATWAPCSEGSGQCREHDYRGAEGYRAHAAEYGDPEGDTTTVVWVFVDGGTDDGSLVYIRVESPTQTRVSDFQRPSDVLVGLGAVAGIVAAGALGIAGGTLAREAPWLAAGYDAARRLLEKLNPFECVPFGADAGLSAGLRRGSGLGGSINDYDVIAHCACQMGRAGPQLANSLGLSCTNAEWSERMRCLVDPTDDVGGIRPECVEYLEHDHGRSAEETLSLWCQATVSCPLGSSATAVGDSLTGVRCRCDTSGGGGSGLPRDRGRPGCGPRSQPKNPEDCLPPLPIDPPIPLPMPEPDPFPLPLPFPRF